MHINELDNFYNVFICSKKKKVTKNVDIREARVLRV